MRTRLPSIGLKQSCDRNRFSPKYFGKSALPSSLVTIVRPKFTPKLPIPFDDHHPHLIHPSLVRPRHQPRRLRIQSVVLPQYSTFSGQTDRQTDTQTHRLTHGLGDRSVRRTLTLYYIESERRAKMRSFRSIYHHPRTGNRCRGQGACWMARKLTVGLASHWTSFTDAWLIRLRTQWPRWSL